MSRRSNKSLPGFEPAANRSAGPAASGIRVGFPAERTVILNYCDIGSFASSTGIPQKYQFRLNSAYDPDYTATGHQPMCFDQWALFYNHYVVEETTYDVEIALNSGSAAAGGHNSWIGVHLSDDPTIPVSPSELMELGSQTAFTNPYSAVNSHIFKGKVSMAKFLNRPALASDSEVRAAVGANPVEQVILSLWGVNADFVSSNTFYYGIKLAMKIRFMEPKDLSPSVAVPRPLAKPTSAEERDVDYEYVRVKRIGAPPQVKMPAV